MLEKVLSIKNPISYLVVSGIKDVENRTWSTNYRGWIYIHSSGNNQYWLPELEAYPDVIENINKYEKKKTKQTPWYVEKYETLINHIAEYHAFSLTNSEQEAAAYKIAKKNNDFYLQSNRIIGRVKLVDVVMNSKSPFALPDQFHWILKDAQMFKNPIKQVNGKLRLFDFNIPDSYLSSDNIL